MLDKAQSEQWVCSLHNSIRKWRSGYQVGGITHSRIYAAILHPPLSLSLVALLFQYSLPRVASPCVVWISFLTANHLSLYTLRLLLYFTLAFVFLFVAASSFLPLLLLLLRSSRCWKRAVQDSRRLSVPTTTIKENLCHVLAFQRRRHTLHSTTAEPVTTVWWPHKQNKR